MRLRETIDRLCLQRLGRLPNIESPQGFNDCIQWLKLHDQRRGHIVACDKWAARSLAPEANRIPARLGIVPQYTPGVLKCTHDSGSVRIFEDEPQLRRAQNALTDRLHRIYGRDKGEWAYEFVPPRLMTETLLARNITDFKFHCSHGKIRWVQVISDRAKGARETILSPDGMRTGLHMDQNMTHAPDDKVWPGVIAWERLIALAEVLAAPWRYVRVDLYWAQERAWFGELTFWPLAGCYRTKDEPTFGEMLELDLTDKREPIVA